MSRSKRAETEEDRAEREKNQEDYPLDPGAAYESEPEPVDESFAEPEHWLQPGRRARGA